jgi:hypothetical protein
MPENIEKYEGLKRWYSGDWNSACQTIQPDGSIIIRLYAERDNRTFIFQVKDLYGENEEVLDHTELDNTPPGYILERMKKAKEASQNA